MKKCMFFALCLIVVASTAHAQRFGLGIGVGASGYTSEVDKVFGDARSHIGFLGSGKLLFLVDDWFLIGFNAEGDFRNLKQGSADFAEISTISLIPYVELRGPANAYLFLGVGYNLNSGKFDKPFESPDAGGLVKDLEIDDTIAFKGGAGWDLFIDDNFALNIEVGWKYNKGDAYVRVSEDGVTKKFRLSDSLDASTVTGTLGIRYYFP